MGENTTIYARARFAFRSDSSENWKAENPILLAGEHGVVTDGSETEKEKIGDGLTPWNELGWWKGPQGEAGPQGEKGDKGDKGEQGEKGDTGEVSLEYAHNNLSGVLKGTKSGEIIAVSDVSALQHDLKINLTSDTVTDFSNVSVTRIGKNLIPQPYNFTSPVETGLTITKNDDGTILVNGTSTTTVAIRLWSVNDTTQLKAGKYYVSDSVTGEAPSGTYVVLSQNNAGTANGAVNIDSPFYINLRLAAGTYNDVLFKPMLEVGSVGTDYEPYIAPQTVTAGEDGTVDGLTSLYPSMTIYTDTEGVTVNCEYNRDINKAFAEITQAIINLGGTLNV